MESSTLAELTSALRILKDISDEYTETPIGSTSLELHTRLGRFVFSQSAEERLLQSKLDAADQFANAIEATLSEPKFETTTFRCLSDYRKCRDEAPGMGCIIALIFCVGKDLVPGSINI